MRQNTAKQGIIFLVGIRKIIDNVLPTTRLVFDKCKIHAWIRNYNRKNCLIKENHIKVFLNTTVLPQSITLSYLNFVLASDRMWIVRAWLPEKTFVVLLLKCLLRKDIYGSQNTTRFQSVHREMSEEFKLREYIFFWTHKTEKLASPSISSCAWTLLLKPLDHTLLYECHLTFFFISVTIFNYESITATQNGNVLKMILKLFSLKDLERCGIIWEKGSTHQQKRKQQFCLLEMQLRTGVLTTEK